MENIMKKTIMLLLAGCLALFADGPVLKTGQTTVYQAGDDGTYQTGIERSYTRDGASGIVTDNATGLMWHDNNASAPMPWANAKALCDALVLGGYDDWRLPSVKELRTLIDRGGVARGVA